MCVCVQACVRALEKERQNVCVCVFVTACPGLVLPNICLVSQHKKKTLVCMNVMHAYVCVRAYVV